MRCPNGHENRQGATFCIECGAALTIGCGACGRALPPSARFCDGCGTVVGRAPRPEGEASPPAPARSGAAGTHEYAPPPHLAAKILRARETLEGERRTVTVLFIDAVNSMKAGEKLDPEELHRIVHTATDKMIEAVNRFEGTVTQFRGDGIMAVFGAPIAHEDSARRAVASALAMREMLRSYALELSAAGSKGFAYRIGLNTGPVIVGSIGSDFSMDYTAIGDTVNLAARMEQLAAPDAICLTEDTRRQVAPYFELNDLGPLAVKGKSEMVRVYEVVRERASRTRLDASADRGLTPYIGRSEQLEVLARHFALARGGQGQVVFITGEAGMGKSRLLLEFRRSLGESAHWLEGHCISWGGNFPYLPIVDIVRGNFGIEEGEGDAAITESIDGGTRAWDADAARSAAPHLKYLLNVAPGEDGQMDPSERRERILDALRALLMQESRRVPLVIAVEDLHWADEQSEEALAALVDAVASSPVLLILTYRPGYAHALGDRTYYGRMVLQNLAAADSASMVQGVLHGAGVPERLQRLIVAKAEGNPFFIEEVSRSLVESGVLRAADGGYALARPVEQVTIPDTIQEVILSRLDRLQRDAKEAVQYASVIGREFPVRLLKHIASAEQSIDALLGDLKALELIYEKSYFPELEYMFKHALTQEVALSTLLVDRRRLMHRTVAAAIEELYTDSIGDQHEALAYHYFQGEEWEKACEYAKRVALRATAIHAPRAAIEHATRAIESAQHCDPECREEMLEPELYRIRGAAYESIGEFEASRADYELAMTTAQARGDREAEWRAQTDLGMLWAGNDYDRAGAHWQAGYDIARAVGDERLIAHSLNRLGNWRLNIEQPAEALRHHEEALAIFERSGDRRGIAETLDFLTMGNALAGNFERAYARGQAAVALYRELDERKGLSSVLAAITLAGPSIESVTLPPLVTDPAEARAYGEEALSIARTIGWRAGEAFAFFTIGNLHAGCGEFGPAITATNEGIRIATEIGHEQWRACGLWLMGILRQLCRDYEASLRELEQAGELARRVNSGHWVHTCAAATAQTYVVLGRFEEARRLIAENHAGLEAPRSYAERELWMVRSALQLATGDHEGALSTVDALMSSGRAAWDVDASSAVRLRRAEVLIALGRRDEAETDLLGAVEAARKCSMLPMLWPALAALAAYRKEQNSEDESRELYAEALGAVERIADSLGEVDAALRATLLRSPAVRALRDAVGTRASL